MTSQSFQDLSDLWRPARLAAAAAAPSGVTLREAAGLREPEKRVEEESREWRPTEEWEWGGEAVGLRIGVEWKEADVFSPSWESLEGLWTKYAGRRGDLAGDDAAMLVTSESVFA